MRRKLMVVLVALVVVLALPVGVALAAKPTPFTASGPIVVTEISDVTPAGASGRVRIGSESSVSPMPLVSDSAALNGMYLSMHQKSNELFSSPDFTTAVALDGHSKGTFSVVDPLTGAVVASGQYELKVSNVPGCQVYDEGHWSTTGGGNLKGRGTVTACMNFVPLYGTFVGQVTFTGTLN